MPEESPSQSQSRSPGPAADPEEQGSAPEIPCWADRALTTALVLYVILLAVATYAEVFENEAILRWFR